MSDNIYGPRDIMELDSVGGHYCRHIDRMTAEGLHGKSEIAAELAYRDAQIEYLEKKINSALIAHPQAAPILLQEALDRTHFDR